MINTGIQTRNRLCDKVAENIARTIEKRQAKPGELIASEYDFARQEGVSRMTIRKAVGILAAKGLVVRRPGRGVYMREDGKSTRLVHVVVPDITLDLCAAVARGVKKAALKVGAHTLIHDAHGNFESDLHSLRRLPKTSVDGAVIWSRHDPRFAEVLYELHSAEYPFVLVDETLRNLAVPSVVADNYRGGYLVGEELIRRGHCRIGFVGFEHIDTVRARLDGLRDALTNAGLLLHLPLIGWLSEDMAVVEPTGWSDEIDRIVGKIIDRPDRPTAIFFSNDHMAACGYSSIRGMGLRIPEDVSVVGFDGIALGRFLTPTLASVRQPAMEMGAAAMEMLSALMAHGQTAGAGEEVRPPPTGQPGGGPGNIVTSAMVAGVAVAAQRQRVNSIAARRSLHRVLPVLWQEGGSIAAVANMPAVGMDIEERRLYTPRGY